MVTFCYGEKQLFKATECAAALLVLLQLELKNCKDVEGKIEEYMKKIAKKDVSKGVKMLEDCVVKYEMDDNEKMKKFCEYMAKILVTKDNIKNHSELVINCLMKLPSYYLDIVEYGDAHTDNSEFNIRICYIKYNTEIYLSLKCYLKHSEHWTYFYLE